MEFSMRFRRSHHCNALTLADEGREVALAGWVHANRDHGGLVFIDLRDREGLTQIVFDPKEAPDAHEAAAGLRREYVVAVRGTVVRRSPETVNPKLPTGQVEVRVREAQCLNASENPPFELDDDVEVSVDCACKGTSNSATASSRRLGTSWTARRSSKWKHRRF